MNCREFDQILDELMDGELPTPRAEAARRHTVACTRCRARLLDEESLRAALRTLPPPAPPSPGFVDRALAQARKRGAGEPSSRVRLPALALAASLTLGIGIGALLVREDAPSAAPQVMLTDAAQETRTVALRYNAKRSLAGVRVTLRMPPHVAVEGYEDRQVLTWRTDLNAGANVLRLPLVAREPGSGYLETELVHGEKRKTFRIELVVRPAGEAQTPAEIRI